MSDYDWHRVLGVNGSVLAVSLSEVEAMLSIVLLTATIVWTVTKLVILFDEKKKNKKKDD
tara:strand:+ start:657 stop:836 length:180 start_codon:yes stop_codon:yes gene_type:complete